LARLDSRGIAAALPRPAASKELEQINARTAKLHNELRSAIQVPATAQPTPVTALVASGMNDVLNCVRSNGAETGGVSRLGRRRSREG
jgi:hypothetical protein